MFPKLFILFSVIVTIKATGVSLVNTGVSSTSRSQDSNGNYEFSYDITDAQGASNSRSERGDAYGNKQGAYSLRDTDGRSRTVDYIADGQGFRAVVKTNEQGTAFSAPAGVVIDSPFEEPKAPEPVTAVPVIPPVPITQEQIAVPATQEHIEVPVTQEHIEVPASEDPIVQKPIVDQVVQAPVSAFPAPISISPAARPAPVAHPAPIKGGAFVAPVIPVGPATTSHSSRVDIVHTVPVRASPFAHVIPVASPFFVRPVTTHFGHSPFISRFVHSPFISRFGHSHSFVGAPAIIYGKH